jgi:hypothetical protein
MLDRHYLMAEEAKEQGSRDGVFLYENKCLGRASRYHAIGRGEL